MQCAEVGGSREDDEQHTGPGESTLAHSIELEMKEYQSDGMSVTEQPLERLEKGSHLWVEYCLKYVPLQSHALFQSRQCLPAE